MKTLTIITLITTLGLSASGTTSASTKAEIEDALKKIEFEIPKSMNNKLNAIQWTMKASKDGRPVLSGNHYQLVNLAINRGIKRQKRAKAANLGFLKSSSKKMNMLIIKQSGSGQIRYGDIVALNLKPYGWLRYKKQGSYGGINLSDDDHKPHFIWKITGGKQGTKLVSGMPFALMNIKPVKREIIYCQRASGIDLGWRGKSKCGGTLAKISNKAFGANGALSGEGLTGKLAKNWKDRLCKAAVGAAAGYITTQSAGTTTAAVAAAIPHAVKKCNAL
ncbi:MAG: hypothetical protein PVG20_02700 [Thioalkalispiraceae bacterium]|jgi:hypothetical protein